MNKIVLCLLALFLLATTSCFKPKSPTPYGKWENPDIGLILDINPEYLHNREHFRGQYQTDSEVLEIIIVFARAYDELGILSIDANHQDGLLWSDETVYFNGTFNIKDGKLHLYLFKKYQERYGIITIVFSKIEDYDAPR